MKLKIELLSDLCTYSGETYNSVVDTDIVYDRYGLPYIPARRIKGCIREACMELMDLSCMIEIKGRDSQEKASIPVDPEIFEKLFGKEGNSDAAFALSNAYLEDYPRKTAALMTAKGEAWMSPQKVLDLYTYTRTQTAVDLEKGAAQKNSLRTMRVIRKGLVFEAELAWRDKNIHAESPEFQVLDAAVSMVKHIGFGRTRGLGLVSLALLPENTDETERDRDGGDKITEDSVDANYEYHRIEYRADLSAPVICKASTGNQASTQDYIEGGKILGFLAGLIGSERYRALTEKSDLIVSNAYILCDGKRTIPARNSWKIQKDETFDDDGRMNLWEMLSEPDVANMQMTPAKLHYVNESGVTVGVDTEITYHHRRPDNKATGRATGKDNSSFYQLESIQSGQSFGGYILADASQAREILRAAGSERRARLGYGKNTQFGDAMFRITGISPVKKKRNRMKMAAVTLVSDVILYNHNGVPSASEDCLKEYLQAALGLNKEDFQIKNRYFSYTTVGGYNTSWKTFKPVIPALGKGSVFIICAEREFEQPEPCFLGERVSEGFGEVRFDGLPESERYMVYKYSPDKPVMPTEDIDRELLEQLKEREEIRKLKKHIRDITGLFEKPEAQPSAEITQSQRETAGEIAKLIQKDADSFGTAVAKLRMIYQSVPSYQDFIEQIDGICSKSAKEACKKISGCIDLEKLTKQYQIRREGDEAYRMIYHIYLTELKYLAKIVKEKAKEAKKCEQSG